MKYKLKEIHMISLENTYTILKIISSKHKIHIYEVWKTYNKINYKNVHEIIDKFIAQGMVNDLGIELNDANKSVHSISISHKGQTLLNLISALIHD
jgi:predicted transcriptional regulator